MFRALLAAAGVVLLFVAVLFFSGDIIKAWESPGAAAPARAARAPGARSTAKAKPRKVAPRKHPRKRKISRDPTWLTRLNALCRRGQAETAAIPRPETPEAAGRYFRQFDRLNKRWNRQAEPLLAQAAGRDPQAVRGVLRLFEQEERLVEAIVSAAERHKFEQFGRLAPALLAVAKSENRLLARLGATDCTLPDEAFEL